MTRYTILDYKKDIDVISLAGYRIDVQLSPEPIFYVYGYIPAENTQGLISTLKLDELHNIPTNYRVEVIEGLTVLLSQFNKIHTYSVNSLKKDETTP